MSGPMGKKLKLTLLAGALTVLLLPFQNCAPSGKSSNGDGDQGSLNANAKMCGFEGFEYLHANYFNKFCTSCHAKTGFAFPPFSDPDVVSSYSWTKSIAAEKLWETSTNNTFCGDACSLKPGELLYDQLAEWLDHRESCD
ncbi:MAG: hypothetical protein H6624_07295 [Bdellovibrionaceae bacterium]|nr:hypothetical protein [Bdellovibrionales bacterium]MCB9084133.1 hypothetical protein [Pseudobdellovibrionaceae bacterium]